MTEPQRKRLYFPAWRRAFRCAWVEDRGLWLCWVRLIEDDTQLDALIRWENPDQIERDRIVRGILAGGAGGYAARLSADIYGTSNWQDLTFEQLLSLHTTLRQRRNAWQDRRPIPTPL